MKRFRNMVFLSALALCAACDFSSQPPSPPSQSTPSAPVSESDTCHSLASSRLALYDRPDVYPLSEKEHHDAYVSLYTECMRGHDWRADGKKAGDAASRYPAGYTVIENTQGMPGKTNTYSSPNGSTVVIVQSPQTTPVSPSVIYASPPNEPVAPAPMSQTVVIPQPPQPRAVDNGVNTAATPMSQTVVIPQRQQAPVANNAAPTPMSQTVVVPESSSFQPVDNAPPAPKPLTQTVVLPSLAPQTALPNELTAPTPMSQTVVIPEPHRTAAVPAAPTPMSQTVVLPQPQNQTSLQPISRATPMSQTIVMPQAQTAAPGLTHTTGEGEPPGAEELERILSKTNSSE